MGMFAEIIAIGPFTKKAIEYMEYPLKYYENTEEGSIVNQVLFGISEGTKTSHEFAACFGIDNPWDFNQHKIDNSAVSLEKLENFVSKYTDYDQDYKIFRGLFENGFHFHFSPNG